MIPKITIFHKKGMQSIAKYVFMCIIHIWAIFLVKILFLIQKILISIGKNLMKIVKDDMTIICFLFVNESQIR